MKNSKLASLLSKLSLKEFKDFGKFVKSPYFNSNSNIIKLYDLIAKSFPDLDNPKLTKEKIYSYIYPREKYNDSTVRGLLASTLKLGEEFLAVSHLKSDKNHYTDFLLSELSERKIYDVFNIHLKNARAELDSSPTMDEGYFFVKYRMETLISQIESKAYIPLTQKDIPGDTHTNDTDNLINYFLISILKRYNYLLSKTGSLNVSLDLKFFDEIMSYLGKINLEEVPMLNFHYHRAMLYTSKMDEKYFYILKKILYDNFDNLDHTERYNLLATLQNFCVQKNRLSKGNTAEVQYELYAFAIEKDILTFDDYEPLHHILFSNIVGAMIFMNKIDEAKSFIEKYKHRLAPDRVESSENLNMAKVFFKEGKYDKVLERLALAQNDDVFYKAAIKNLYAMTYYEMGYIEELYLLIDSYRSFLNSNVVLGQRLKDNHLNFINALSKLLKLKDVGEKSELEYLKYETNKLELMISHSWLLKKIDEYL